MNDIRGVFDYSAPIEDATRLIGRRRELQQAIQVLNLQRRGVPILIGTPGSGKSSLLNIIAKALTGDRDSLEAAGVGRGDLGKTYPKAVRITCSNEFDSPAALDRHIEASLSAVGGGLVLGTGAVEVFGNRSPKADDLLLLLDECERLSWRGELLQHMQSAWPSLRFAAATRDYAYREILLDLQGDNRRYTPVWLRGLESGDVGEVYRNARTLLLKKGISWGMDAAAEGFVASRSAGEPWYLQLMGYILLTHNLAEKIEPINAKGSVYHRTRLGDVVTAEQTEMASRLRHLYGREYERLVTRSTRREELLVGLAQCPVTRIPIEFLRYLGRERGFGALDVARRLASLDPPTLLIEGGEVSFTNHQFRVHCRLLPTGTAPLAVELARAFDWDL